jgi:hypothetical protein
MTTTAIKINSHKFIDVVNDNTMLKAVHAILEKEAKNDTIVGYSINGKAITKQMLDEELEVSEMEIKKGQTITHSQLKKEIASWRVKAKK